MSEQSALTIDDAQPQGEWTVVAQNRRVLKAWEGLVEKVPESASDCLHRLSTKPMERIPGRVFPLRHKKHKGAWEYEVTSGDRVFYIPDSDKKKVVVYYAGKHVTPAPYPPGI